MIYPLQLKGKSRLCSNMNVYTDALVKYTFVSDCRLSLNSYLESVYESRKWINSLCRCFKTKKQTPPSCYGHISTIGFNCIDICLYACAFGR